MNEQFHFIEEIKKTTGAKAFINEDEEIVCQPEQLHKIFFTKLLSILIDTPFTFLVNRNLEVIIFKP